MELTGRRSIKIIEQAVRIPHPVHINNSDRIEIVAVGAFGW